MRRSASTGIPTSSGVDASVAGRSGWIVSPLFDLLFFANLLWLLAFVPAFVSAEGKPHVEFWMAYYLATPHRWMTILLAVFDPDRREGKTWQFVAIAVLTALLIGAVVWVDGNLRRLALLYALLVGWHFASQHAGILRIYSRKAGGGRRWLETWPPRIFVLYGSMRLLPGLDNALRYLFLELDTVDLVMLGIPAVMLAVELFDRPWQRLPKLLYLASFSGLYSALILAAHFHNRTLCFALLAGATIFHSVEYLAGATHYAWRRRTLGSAGVFQKMARNWAIVFPWYVVGAGLIYNFGDKSFVFIWFIVNLWASILHCAFDGMMWKLGDPATAKVLDVEIPTPMTPTAAPVARLET